MSALMLVPAMALAETSSSGGGTPTHGNSKPNTTTAESSENKGGQKFYPDWAAVKKIEGASQKGASEANQAGQSDPTKSAGVKPNEGKKSSEQQSKDVPGLVEKAEQIFGQKKGRST